MTNGNKVNLYVGGAVQDVEQSYQEPCNQPRGAFTWSGDSSSVSYTPLAPFEADTDYTVVLSTAVQGLEEPYVLRFSTRLPGNWQQTTLGGSGFTSYDAATETFTLEVSGGAQLFSQSISSGEVQLFEACLELQSDDPAAKAAIVLYQGIEDSQYQNPWIEVAKTSGGTTTPTSARRPGASWLTTPTNFAEFEYTTPPAALLRSGTISLCLAEEMCRLAAPTGGT